MHDFLRSLKRNPRVIPIFVMIALIMVGNGLIGPILPLYAQTFGVSATLVGFLLSAFGIARLLANIPTGIMAAFLGRRFLLCLGALLIGAAAVGAALSDSFAELVAWRAVQGFGSGIYMTTSGIALAQLAPREDRAELMSLYQAAMLTGGSAGPAIGGVLASAFGYTAPFWAHAVVALGAFLTAFLIPRDARQAKDPLLAEDRPTLHILRGVVFVTACVVVFAVTFTRSASQWLLIPLVGHHKFGLDAAMIGLAITLLAASNLLALPWAPAVMRYFGLRVVAVASLLVIAAGLLAVAYGQSILWFWLGMLLFGLGSGLNGPAVSTHLVEIVPPRLFSASTALHRTVGDAGIIVGPIVIGVLNDWFDIGNVGGLVANVLVLLVAAAIFSLVKRRPT